MTLLRVFFFFVHQPVPEGVDGRKFGNPTGMSWQTTESFQEVGSEVPPQFNVASSRRQRSNPHPFTMWASGINTADDFAASLLDQRPVSGWGGDAPSV